MGSIVIDMKDEEITPEMIEAGVTALVRFNRDYEGEREAVVRIYRAMLDAETRMPRQVALGTALKKMDRIHSEFERCEQHGLQYPSWDDLGRI